MAHLSRLDIDWLNDIKNFERTNRRKAIHLGNNSCFENPDYSSDTVVSDIVQTSNPILKGCEKRSKHVSLKISLSSTKFRAGSKIKGSIDLSKSRTTQCPILKRLNLYVTSIISKSPDWTSRVLARYTKEVDVSSAARVLNTTNVASYQIPFDWEIFNDSRLCTMESSICHSKCTLCASLNFELDTNEDNVKVFQALSVRPPALRSLTLKSSSNQMNGFLKRAFRKCSDGQVYISAFVGSEIAISGCDTTLNIEVSNYSKFTVNKAVSDLTLTSR